MQRPIEAPLSEDVPLGRFGSLSGGEKAKEPVAAAPKRSSKKDPPDLPAEGEETADTA